MINYLTTEVLSIKIISTQEIKAQLMRAMKMTETITAESSSTEVKGFLWQKKISPYGYNP
jgi:hypothetical protein